MPYRYVSGQEKLKRNAYRKTDAGRLARKFYHMRPEVRMRMAIRRKIKAHMKGKA